MSGPYDHQHHGQGQQQYVGYGQQQGGYDQGSYQQHDQGYNQGYNQGNYNQGNYNQGGYNQQGDYPPQQSHSPYPQDNSSYAAPPAPTYDSQQRQHSQGYGPPQQGGFQHGQLQAPSYAGSYPQQQPYGQYPDSNTQQYPQQGPYSQSPAPTHQYSGGGPSDPAVQQEGDRGLLGAVAGGIGGHMFGKKHNHGVIGTLAGAFLGSKAEDMLKGKNSNHHKHHNHHGHHGGGGGW